MEQTPQIKNLNEQAQTKFDVNLDDRLAVAEKTQELLKKQLYKEAGKLCGMSAEYLKTKL
jgi:hypothetical protein